MQSIVFIIIVCANRCNIL